MRLLVLAAAVVAVILWWSAKPLCSCTSKSTAYAAAVRSDMRNVVTAQESYFADHERYAPAVDSLPFVASTNVVIVVSKATAQGWSAVGLHEILTGWCVVYAGDVEPPARGLKDGEPGCRWAIDGHLRETGLFE